MDEQYRQRVEEIAREMIRSGEFDHPVNPDRDARLDRNNQDDWSLSYSITDIPTFDGKGESLPHTYAKSAILVFPLTMQAALLRITCYLPFSCRPRCALVLGNCCERFCASRSLLGSYIHQKSI